jgi:L-threonylcarbamoyladenylate synthase
MKLKNLVPNFYCKSYDSLMSLNRPHQSLINIDRAVELLRQGEVVAIPTETVYGLGADITQSRAIEKIFATKQRPFFDPLIVHIAEIDQLKQLISPQIYKGGQLPTLIQKLTEAFWPGPLTLVLPKNKNVNAMITSGLETVAVRMPKHDLTLQVIRDLREPLAAPSANLFGRTSPTTAEHVIDEFGGSVSVIDGGACTVGVESTVIGFDSALSEISIYRPGAITHSMLSNFARTKMAPTPVADAPGQLKHHYMPKIPLIYLKNTNHLTIDLYERLKSELGVDHLMPSWVTLSSDEVLAARQLYSSLRWAAEKPNANCILLRRRESSNSIHAQDYEQILDDRLSKASTFVF